MIRGPTPLEAGAARAVPVAFAPVKTEIPSTTRSTPSPPPPTANMQVSDQDAATGDFEDTPVPKVEAAAGEGLESPKVESRAGDCPESTGTNSPQGETEAAPSTGLHPTVDIFDADPEEYDQHRPLQQPYDRKEEQTMDSRAAKNEPGEDLDHDPDFEVDYAGDAAEYEGGEPLGVRPAEPEGAPSGLTARQRQRLQQLLSTGRLRRLHEDETDLMVWKRYRDESKQNYRAQRRTKRRSGEWNPDLQRRR